VHVLGAANELPQGLEARNSTGRINAGLKACSTLPPVKKPPGAGPSWPRADGLPRARSTTL